MPSVSPAVIPNQVAVMSKSDIASAPLGSSDCKAAFYRGGVGRMRHAAAGGLSERERDVDVAAGFEHHVGEIVGSKRILRLDFQCFLVGLPGVFPILLRFVEFTHQNVETSFAGIVF